MKRPLVLVVMVPVLLIPGCSSDSKPSPPEPTPIALPAQRLRAIESDLVSGQAVRVRRAIELPPGTKLNEAFIKGLHGLTITFDRETAVKVGEDQFSVRATVGAADGTTEQWQVTLDLIDGTYLVADTHSVEQ